jgi:nucleotide-binding universal stress UspA family protein
VKKLHRVLAAVDFSAPARAAFDRAIAVSREHDAELTVVHAVPSDEPFKWYGGERRDLIGELRATATAAGVRFNYSIQSGDPAGVILLHANARGADLIVLGSSARSGLDRVRFGSVAETVARKATRPVLVVPAASTTSADGAPPLKSIVVAVDLRDGSSAVVESALSMANAGTRVTLVHVIPRAGLAGTQRYMYHRMDREYHSHLARDAWKGIAGIAPAGTSSRIHARVVVGDPAEEIARVAREVGADLVLVSVPPRSAVGRLLVGSTAVRLIRTSGVPVLTMPSVKARMIPPASDADQFAVAA